MNAVEIAARASELVGGSRNATHGDMAANFANIAHVWNGILAAAGKGGGLDAHDVANLMEGLKIARRYTGARNEDDYVDGAGYAACAGELRPRLSQVPRK